MHGQAPLDGGRQGVQPDAVDRGHPHRARHDIHACAQALLERGEALQHRLGLAVQQATGLGGPGADARRALDEAAAVAALERVELLADGGLGHEVEAGGAREAARLHEVAKGLEGFDVHRFISLPKR